MDGENSGVPEELQVLLAPMADPLLTEPASTDNVSSHGMRVQTARPWKRNTGLIVKSPQGELWGSAKVVYCQTLPAVRSLWWRAHRREGRVDVSTKSPLSMAAL
jgi:hypothetical protein